MGQRNTFQSASCNILTEMRFSVFLGRILRTFDIVFVAVLKSGIKRGRSRFSLEAMYK